MCLTRNERYRIITGRELPAPGAQTIQYDKSGPGEFDALRCLDEKTDNWQTIQTLQTTPEKPKIIFCYPALSKTVLSPLEDSLFNGICEDFDVYLWQGPRPFSEMRPVANDKILREKMASAMADNEDNVLHVFEQQRLATHDIYVWDAEGYVQILTSSTSLTDNDEYNFFDLPEFNRKKKFGSTREFDLLDKSLVNIFRESTRVIQLFAPSVEEVKKTRECYPDIATIYLKGASATWLNSNLSLFNGLSLHIIGDDYNDLTHLILSKEIKLRDLTVSKCPSLESIQLNGAQFRYLLVSQCNHFHSVLSDAPNYHLINLIITGTKDLLALNLSPFNALTTLTVTNCPNLMPDQLTLPKEPALGLIRINKWAKTNQVVDFTACKKLKKAFLPDNNLYKLPPMPAMKEEKHRNPVALRNMQPVYRKTISHLKEFKELASHPSCERVLISHYRLRSKEVGETVFFSDSPQVKSVTIINAEDGARFDLRALKQLEELNTCRLNIVDMPELRSMKRLVLNARAQTYSDIVFLQDYDLRAYDSVESLEVRGNGDQILLPVGNAHLRSLFLDNVNLPENLDFATSYPNLEKLILYNCTGIDRARLPDTLQCLVLKYSSLVTFNNPKRLKVFTYWGAREDQLDFILSGLKQLRSVEINAVGGFSYPITLIVDHCPELLELKVTAKKNDVDLFIRESNNIEYLDLSIFNGCKLSEADGLESCHKLRSFNITAGNLDEITPKIPRGAYKHAVNLVNSAPQESKELKAQDNELKLHLQNSSNPVTFFSSHYVDTVDAPTNDRAKTYQANPNQHHFTGTVFSNNNKHSGLYRINPFNGIYWINDTIDFYVKFNLRKINLPQQPLPTIISGLVNNIPEKTLFTYVQGSAIKNQPMPIIGVQAIENPQDVLQIYADPVDAADIVWDQDQQHCYAVPKSDLKLRIMLHVKENPAYESKDEKITGLVTSTPEQIFAPPNEQALKLLKNLHANDERVKKLLQKPPKDLHKALREKLDQVDTKFYPEFLKLYVQLFKSSLDTEQKFQAILNYCKNKFTEGVLNAKASQPLDILVESIVKRKGACRHVSRAFWVLAGLIGIPILMPRNEQHQFVDVPYQDQDGVHLRRFDLGGLMRLDLTPSAVRDKLLTQLVPAQPQSETKTVIHPQALLEEAKEQEYYRKFKRLVKPRYIEDWKELLNNSGPLPPSIELNPSQDPLLCCEKIYKTFEESKFNMQHFHTIHSAEEFKKFFEPLALVNGQWQRLPEGPLKETMKEQGVIVVNWAALDNEPGFTAAQIASYKSILDQPPMLFEHPFPLKVINITNKNSDSTFSSRTRPYRLNPEMLESSQETKEARATLPQLNIELDGSRRSWRKQIYGKLTFKGKSKTLSDSEFIQAIKSQKPIEIIFNQPPNDRDFKIFKYRLEVEKRVFFNGKFLPVTSTIKVTIQNKPSENKLPSNLILNGHYEKPHNRIYVSANTLHELKEQLIIDEKQEGYTSPGRLETANGNDVFYLTESIPKEEQNALHRFIGTLKNTVHLVTTEKAAEIKMSDRFFVSNDHDYLAEQLAEKHDALIIDVTPDTSFKSLVAEIDDLPSGFKYQEHDMIKLLAEKNIILNGAISSTLYHQLFSLFTEPNQIHLNGKTRTVNGKLMLVQPKTAKFIPKQSIRQDFQFADYRKVLDGDSKTNNEIFSQIEKYYQIISQLPHQGPGVPAKPTPSYHLLKNMMNELKQDKPLHKRNPIKAIFSYDYPITGEEYAFVNVMAKRLFTASDKSEMRKDKLHKLVKQFNITSPEKITLYLWRILNCFNGAELCALFKESDIVFTGDTPVLPLPLLTQLFKKISELPPAEKKANRSQKQLGEFKHLINEEKTDFIMLKGDTGVGKTEAVRKLLPKKFCELHNIHEWLLGDKTYLLLDEANMKKPGIFDFLKGLTRKPRQIYYPPDGKFYDIPPGKKVLMTCNPENFPGRHWHDFFQKYVKTCYFKKPTDAELKVTTLVSLKEEIKEHLLFAYHLIEKYNPFLASSYRDIENLRDRFLALLERGEKQALFDACVGQYAGAIQNPEQRQAFIEELTSRFDITEIKRNDEVRKIKNVFITPQKEYLIDAIEQDLLMRDVFIKKQLEAKEKTPPAYKTAIVIEGEPGTGKSSLFRAIAEKYNPITISGGSTEVAKILIEAFHAGRIVILDEFNLDPELEILKNELMSGRYQGELAEKPGFMILASQNASGLAGRKSQSPAEINRTHFLYMDPYTHRERIMIADAAGIQCPTAFANGYQKVCSVEEANMRTFFTGLAEQIELQSKIKKAPIKKLEKNESIVEEKKDPLQIWINFTERRLEFLRQNDPASIETSQTATDLEALRDFKNGKKNTNKLKSTLVSDFLKELQVKQSSIKMGKS